MIILEDYKKKFFENTFKKAKKSEKLMDLIKRERLYNSNPWLRNILTRKYLEKNIKVEGPSVLLTGQLVMFNYFTPKNKEDLEYYDAKPCTIFFGATRTKEGPRVVGFNLHYYPPKVRYAVMAKIYDLFKGIYTKEWDKPIKQNIPQIDYAEIMQHLYKEGLDFGVRMYIPRLMMNIKPIPPSMWSKAVFTEGEFKKKTRTAILLYWKKHSLSNLSITKTIKDYAKGAKGIMKRRFKQRFKK